MHLYYALMSFKIFGCRQSGVMVRVLEAWVRFPALKIVLMSFFYRIFFWGLKRLNIAHCGLEDK